MKCLNCNTETINPKFCSRKCAQVFNNKLYPKRLRKTKCSKCDKITKSYRHSLCEEHTIEYLKTRKNSIKDKTLLEYWKLKSLSDLHKSSKNVHIRALARNWFKNLTKKPCANCGYDKHVELCHIKAISSFSEDSKLSDINSESNIIQLCPNCHWELDKGLLEIVENGGLKPKPISA